VIETIEKDDLLANARTVGAHLAEGLARDERVTEVRARGLLVGIDLSEERAARVVDAAQDRGFIVNMTAPGRIRLAPPLILTVAQADELLAAWPEILDAAYRDADDPGGSP
jgi:acetylornithine aminotransferase